MSENSPSGGSNIHLERQWKISMTPTQLISIISGCLIVAGGIARFEWFISHTKRFEEQTTAELIRIEHHLSIPIMMPQDEPAVSEGEDSHSYPSLVMKGPPK